MRKNARILPVITAVLAAFAACGHGEPFATPDNSSTTPKSSGTPIRLTYNVGLDQGATWLPDESGILYSADRADFGNDRCLVVLPPDGGRVTRTICDTYFAADDSLNVFDEASVAPAGDRVAFIRQGRLPNQSSVAYTQLALSPLDAPIDQAKTIRALPFSIGQGGPVYITSSQINWKGDATLVYRADFAGIVCIAPGSPCPTAFVQSGLNIAMQPLDSAAAVTIIPGTVGASSLTLSPDGDAMYYTLNGDTRIYRRVLSTGVVTVLYDFGGSIIVRDVQAAAGALYAVIGGNVDLIDAPGVGILQWDHGGLIVKVNLATNSFTPVSFGASFTHLALSPSGTRLVAESFGDLYLFEL